MCFFLDDFDFSCCDCEVYTYNIGSYEGGMRDDDVPCVPSNVDASHFQI